MLQCLPGTTALLTLAPFQPNLTPHPALCLLPHGAGRSFVSYKPRGGPRISFATQPLGYSIAFCKTQLQAVARGAKGKGRREAAPQFPHLDMPVIGRGLIELLIQLEADLCVLEGAMGLHRHLVAIHLDDGGGFGQAGHLPGGKAHPWWGDGGQHNVPMHHPRAPPGIFGFFCVCDFLFLGGEEGPTASPWGRTLGGDPGITQMLHLYGWAEWEAPVVTAPPDPSGAAVSSCPGMEDSGQRMWARTPWAPLLQPFLHTGVVGGDSTRSPHPQPRQQPLPSTAPRRAFLFLFLYFIIFIFPV